MDHWFYFLLHPTSSEEEALQELTPYGLQYPSLLEDAETGERSLCGVANPSLFPSSWKHIVSYTLIENTEINWQEEWNTFSPYFKDGVAKIPLSDFCPNSKEEIVLLPGPGFGDLSHPTTTLSLQLLAQFAPHQTIIDLGCGSGVLGLAALQWNAAFIYSLDIDPEALTHTLENAKLNHLEDKLLTSLQLPSSLEYTPTLLVMNMTFGDQKNALKDLTFSPDLWITSGILEEQQDTYISWMKERGLQLQSHIAHDGWIACVFKKM